MRATNRTGAARGIVMLMVIILVALLIIIALLVANGAFNAETNAQAVAVKYRVLNSAEGGANAALNQLAEDPTVPSPRCYPGTLNGKDYSGCVEVNNLKDPLKSKDGIDPATGNKITVPPKSAYIYGESSFNGGRKVYIEAIAALAPPITLPSGAINAAGKVDDQSSEPISSQTPLLSNANVRANGDIVVSGGSPSIVQGTTSAVGTDNLPGIGIPPTNSKANAVLFPKDVQLQQAAQNAKSLAQAGSTVTGSSLAGGGTVVGNAFVDGDLNLNSGTVTLSNGSYVYINGNLCITGTGALANMNTGQNIVVVNGIVSVKSATGFMTAAQQNSLLLVMGTDGAPASACGSGAFAVDLEQPSGNTTVGTIYAASGSVFLGGSAVLSGALDAGRDVFIAGAPAANFIYDTTQAQTTVTTGTLTYTAYNEN